MNLLGFLDYTPLVDIELGPLKVSPHGVATGVGFAAGAWLLLRTTSPRGIPDEIVHSMLTRAIVGALVGARLAYVVNHLDRYDLIEVVRVWEGGASLLGGIAGGVLAALPVMRRHRLSFWTVMDAAAPGLALGIMIGRVGDLIVADHLGKPTDFFLGYRCSTADTASPCVAPIGQAVHQPALYDLISVTILFGFLLWLRRRPLKAGTLILGFGAAYGAARISEDFFRVDETHGLGLTGSQWTALVTVVTCVALLVSGRRPHRIDPSAPLATTAESQ